ncbi:MAG: hypothetical protein A2086_16415 [Spirochaetes bacterium GWD1_27_9]|nr:MAG: hypothetical protein A2Z98_03115 [Spirochaetes bacterium GWB1_27_13]OHD27808.1 MAG: hypothetical protein A2Y34_16600 [Spirochaetes bacterium GWC1_27_15]OHD33016.1 MAG: hypothetical protein A2086_16415 [Spirochaetes bacterium GWD1_27_9]
MENLNFETIDFIVKKMKEKQKFYSSTEDDLKKMLSFAKIKKFNKKEFIYKEEEDVKYFYIIIEGNVEIFKYTDKQTKRIFCVLSSGDDFGMPELAWDEYNINAYCLTDVKLAYITKSDFFNHILNIKSIVIDTFCSMGYIIGEMQQTLTITNAEEKIISYLNYLRKCNSFTKDGIIYVPRTITNEKIATILDLTRETVSRILNTYKYKKIIDITKDHFIIYDLQKIESISYDSIFVTGYYGTPKK